MHIGLKNIQKILTNSENIKEKIKVFLHRDAEVVHSFVDLENHRPGPDKGYWLSVNRIYPAKRIELQLECFRMLPKESLIIVGGYVKGDPSEDYRNELLKQLPKNVKMLGVLSEKDLLEQYANCKGFIATAMDEDFGLTIIEAFAAGKPVVAVNEGGFRETMVDGKTGFLVEPNPEALAKAVSLISKNPKKFTKNCVERAKNFESKEFFRNFANKIGQSKSQIE